MRNGIIKRVGRRKKRNERERVTEPYISPSVGSSERSDVRERGCAEVGNGGGERIKPTKPSTSTLLALPMHEEHLERQTTRVERSTQDPASAVHEKRNRGNLAW